MVDKGRRSGLKLGLALIIAMGAGFLMGRSSAYQSYRLQQEVLEKKQQIEEESAVPIDSFAVIINDEELLRDLRRYNVLEKVGNYDVEIYEVSETINGSRRLYESNGNRVFVETDPNSLESKVK